MSQGRRWLRLEADWEDSPWLDELDGTTAGCWVRILCWIKRNGVRGVCRAPDAGVLARKWRVPLEAVAAIIAAAVRDGALKIDTEARTWTLANWATYQPLDSTAAERMQRYRADKSRLSPLRRNIVTNRNGRNSPVARDGEGGRGEEQQEMHVRFDEVWKLHRRGPKAKALDEYRTAVPSQVSHERLIDALEHYRKTFRDGFAGAHLFRWIREQRWEEHDPQPNGSRHGRLV